MTAHAEPNDQSRASHSTDGREKKSGNLRLLLLVGLLALAVFALWYDYKVARPAVEQAYNKIAVTNAEINAAAEHRRMTSVDVQKALGRSPSETFPSGKYMIEAYRWSAGMPIGLRGLNGSASPGIGMKTHDYFAVYRPDGPDLAFVTHFKFALDPIELAEPKVVANADTETAIDAAAPGMGAPGGGFGGPGGGGPGGGRDFDPEAMFAARDADGDGMLIGEEIPERMRERLEAIDTDGDGGISKEELLERMSQFRGRRGPDGDSGDPAQEPSEEQLERLPLESSPGASAADTSDEAAPSEAPADESAETSEAASEETASEETSPDES